MDKVEYCQKHIDSIFNKSLNPLTIATDSYNDMMELRKGTLFYKYYSLDDPFTIDNLVNGVIHFSNPIKFNDPFDSIMGISIDSIIKSYIKQLVSQYLQTNNCDMKTQQLIIGLFEPASNNNLLDELDRFGILDDLKNNGEVSSEKNKVALKLFEQHPELLDKIKNKKVTKNDIFGILDLEHSNLLKKTVNVELAKNGYNIKLSTSNSVIDNLEKICSQFNIKYDWNKLKLDVEEKKNDLYKLLNDTLSGLIRTTCFSETRDNILMWSHYANKHNGICVAYDFKKSVELQALALPVKYDDNRPIVSENEIKFIDDKWIVDKEKLGRLLIDSFLVKSEAWKYENEWRVLLPKEKLGNDNFSIRAIEAIYFGVKVSDDVIKDTINKLKESGLTKIKYYKMKMHDSSFALIEQEIT